MHVHLIGVSGTGMGALAALFRQRGAVVSGSDVAFDPPIGPELSRLGVQCRLGYSAEHLDPRPDLVVVGNVIRRDNVEASAALALDIPRQSMSKALRTHFLDGRPTIVVAGTHGKTTTTSLIAHMLEVAGRGPGWFVGGLPKDLPGGASMGRVQGSLVSGPAPFVVEGDEYDAVYWEKTPKFFDYVGASDEDVVVLTSIEHDHIDIYPDEAKYLGVFEELVRRLPSRGTIVAHAADPLVCRVVGDVDPTRLIGYAILGEETGSIPPIWSASLAPATKEGQPFDLYVGGVTAGRFTLGVPGRHNVRNALASLAVTMTNFGVSREAAEKGLATFRGVRRRQDLLFEVGGVTVYEDFAHHPTAVDETLRALRTRHPTGRLVAVFEPRSATACRKLHQRAYVAAFDAADRVLLAPLGRSNLPEHERLDLAQLSSEIGARATALPSVGAIVDELARESREGDVVAILSNGAFGGIVRVLEAALRGRAST